MTDSLAELANTGSPHSVEKCEARGIQSTDLRQDPLLSCSIIPCMALSCRRGASKYCGLYFSLLEHPVELRSCLPPHVAMHECIGVRVCVHVFPPLCVSTCAQL